MCALPTGTVTFLFSDIESSTKLWEQYPEAMKAALAKHDSILRQAVESNCGYIVKTTGDGIHAVFETAVQAVSAACAAQQVLQTETWEAIHPNSVRVRMGLHTGEAEIRDGDYYGSAVNRTARLMSIGYGGQILLSNATTDLLQEELPPGITLRDLGEHRLRDLARPEHVYQLVHPALPAEFPPVNSLDRVPNNLPVQLTRFIGREKEVAEITHLLTTARLVTLTGSGGTGKTRLAQEVSAQQLDSFPHGVWLIELAPLANPSQILPTLAQVLSVQEFPATSLSTMIIDYLRDKKALLILDNCEHLIEACARLSDDLLHHCPQLKIIASSREALGIAGEVSYRIPSLQDSEAVELFVDRARATNPKFTLTESSVPAIARVCSRLDGIPLAIELASARIRTLSPEQIAARLDDRFRLLIGGSRTALPRQQTLRALIDWSYDLLSEEEKHLLRITSVFVGGWTLEALEAITEDPNTIIILEQLVNKSLVVVDEHESEMRYSLLETIRQYAREKLLDAGASVAIRYRNLHLNYFLKLSEAAEPRLVSAEMMDAVGQLEVEQDNIRAALEWAMENDPLSALRIVACMTFFWDRQALATEGYTWAKNVLARAEERLDSEEKGSTIFLTAQVKALIVEASLAFRLGKNQAAIDILQDAIPFARKINATKTLAYGLGIGAIVSSFLGNMELAYAWTEESISLSRQYGYINEQAMTSGSIIFLNLISHRPISQEMMDEAIQIARKSGNPWGLGMTIANIGRLKSMTGQLEDAYSYFEEAGTYFKKIRDRMMYTSTRSEIGHLLRKQSRYPEALAVYQETIYAYQETGQWSAVAHELECFAFIAGSQKQNERASILLGAAEALREQFGSAMTPGEQPEYEEALSNLRAQMNETAMAKAWAEGRAMTKEQAIQFALG